MPSSRLSTLGGFSFDVNGTLTPGPSTRKARAVMTYLILHRNADTPRDRLLEIFWPDSDPDHARASLNTALWSIRRCLRTAGVDADVFLHASKSTVRWTGDTSVDAQQFTELALRDATAREALDLFRGEFLEGDYDDWAVTERERLASAYESLLARVIRTSKDADAAQRFISRNPYDEDAYAALIDAELAAGRRSSAVSWIERCRKALGEVGEKPSEAFEARFKGVIYVEPVIPDELALPFTGRDGELGVLAAKITDAKDGHGSVTLVLGEAGIGKSTLLDRARRLAAETGVHVLHAACSSDAVGAYGPWRHVFQMFGAGEFDAFVRAHGGDVTLSVARAITSRLTEPSIVIVDDAHELSGDALEIFVALVQAAASRHAVIVGTRPEGVATLRSRLNDAGFEEIPLGRLDRKNLRWALSQALGGEQPQLLDALYERSGGHPLFFAGLLNSLVHEGTLAREGRAWQLTHSIDAAMELPDTVRRFIETRLQARGDAPRAVACALAIEPAAGADDLTAVLPFGEPTVLDALDDLLALGLIVQPPSGAQFAFAHDLIREVAALELNAGRRTAMHRAFAQRLSQSGELEAALRIARHNFAAGEFLSAAQWYLKSAHAALELNAAAEAKDRSDAGVAAASRLERTPARDLALAQLYRTSARASIATGDADDAIRRAREAVSIARSCGDPSESSRAILDLAAMEGVAFQTLEQQSDAAEAARTAAVSGDEALEAEALVWLASASRRLGQREDALRALRSADELARRTGRSDIGVTAMEESLGTYLTWWQFPEAVEAARNGLDAARRLSPLAEAAIRLTRCALWFLLDMFDEARTEAQLSLTMAEVAAQSGHEVLQSIRPAPTIVFLDQYMLAKIANERADWPAVAGALERAASIANVAKLPRFAEALLLLRIDTLLRRGSPEDDAAAHALAATLSPTSHAQGTVGWSDCVELARARDAARQKSIDAAELLHRALDVLEENAHQAPLETDRAFARLASAAEEIGEAAVAARARERSRYYRSKRITAAGAAWGGQPELVERR